MTILKIKNPFNLLLISAIIALLFSCSASKNTTKSDSDNTESGEKMDDKNVGTYFIIGEGGGFTGLYEQYKVSYNGMVEIWDGTSTNSSTDTYNLDEETTARYFKDLKKLNIPNMELNRPGNMNYSINLVTAEGASTILWSDNYSPSIEVLTFYKEVMNRIRNLK